MAQIKATQRVTSIDDIYDYLHEAISSLRLSPGDKISEAEIAAQFGVSRQPVRDAFRRLENDDLLLIRPQRATRIKRFSTLAIKKARFVRQAVETEVLRLAASLCDEAGAALLDKEMEKQNQLIAKRNFDNFGPLDYSFHKTLCAVAKSEFAFDVIMAEKSKVDRLCLLSLAKEDKMTALIADHQRIADAVKANDAKTAIEVGTFHLARLDDTIANIYDKNANYFED